MRSQTLKRKSWTIVLVAIFIVAAFQVGNQHRLYMHDDEELSYRSTNGDLVYTFNHQITLKDNQAPLWFVTFWAWRTLIGDAETTSRFLGVLTMLPTVAILYRIGRRQLFSAVGISFLIGNGLFFSTHLIFARTRW